MASIQPRGDKFQLRVKNRLLPKPFFHTFDSEDEATQYGELLEGWLAKGVVPAELLTQARDNTSPLVLEVIRSYTLRAPLSVSDDEMLRTVIKEPLLKGARVVDLTSAWADAYVSDMKKAKLAPGTIRKRIGVLARVLDWHFRDITRPSASRPPNPLRQMPEGYSLYRNAEVVDVVRDFRLSDDDVKAIDATLAGVRRPDRERSWPADAEFRLFYRLIVGTGMRLREAYRLRADQFDLERAVLRVEGSKGHRGKIKHRVVPLRPGLRNELAAWCKGRKGLMFSFWSGDLDDLNKCTSRLSARFGTLFDYAGVPQLTEHDLRHEACCRWVSLRGKSGWVFSETEVCRIMGWSDTRMLLRYASLRGEDLSARLG